MKQQFKIEKNVPLPKIRGTGGSEPRYPWPDMEVHDSIFVTGNKAIATTAHSYGKRHNMKFSCRTVDGGVRVWRVK